MNKRILYFKFAFVIIIIMVTLAAIHVSPAHADGTIHWDGMDEKNLPCSYGARWNMNPSGGIDSAVIYVNGKPYTMSMSGNDSWFADSKDYLNSGADVYVEYVGAGGQNYHIELSYCLPGDPTPNFTPVVPTNTPSYTPTDDPGSPTPINTTDPNNPTSTPTNLVTPSSTITFTPYPTVTIIPSLTATPVIATDTSTPYPPQPAVANYYQTSLYPGEHLGAISIGNTTYQLYGGVNAPDGSLMLPSNILGAAFYKNAIWIHRLWKIGYLSIYKGDFIVISIDGGQDLTYKVVESTFIDYGKYPKSINPNEPYQYIATCYANNNGEWIGVELFKIKLVGDNLVEHQK
jgi:hypothetical protein